MQPPIVILSLGGFALQERSPGRWQERKNLFLWKNAPGLYLQYEEGNLHPHALRSGMRIMQFLSCLRAFFLSGLVRIWFLSLS